MKKNKYSIIVGKVGSISQDSSPCKMSQPNYLNVYKGRDGLRKYFDPDAQPPLPLVELPEKLNPFFKDNVRIYAKLLTVLPAQNVKALPGDFFFGYKICTDADHEI